MVGIGYHYVLKIFLYDKQVWTEWLAHLEVDLKCFFAYNLIQTLDITFNMLYIVRYDPR